MREIIKPALILFAVCAITTIALAGIKAATQGTIDTRISAELEQAKKDVLPIAASFEELAIDKVKEIITAKPENQYLATIQNVYIGHDVSGAVVGSVYNVKSKGYDASGIKMTIGIDAKGTIVDIKVVEQLETPGLGTNVLESQGSYLPQYRGKTPVASINLTKTAPTQPEDIQAVSGATITSRAVSRAAQGALEFSRTLNTTGGSK